MRFLFAVVASLALVSAKTHHSSSSAQLSEKELESSFSSFVKEHNKKYTHDDFFNRFQTYKINMENIRLHNLSGATFEMASNEFADLTWDEFRASKLGFKNIDHSVFRSANAEPITNAAPASVDWRKKNIVTAVKNQGQCGSCWAFSTTGSIESAVAQKKSATPIPLSEQQLVDCSTSQGNQGCNGGLMDYAFQYVISNGGITTEAAYPYKGVDGTCNTSAKSSTTIKSFKDVPAGDEKSLLSAVALQPVSIAIEADQSAFQFYSKGILSANCGKTLDHGVLAVGYGTDAGVNYWIVKNSWGASWGEAGYIRIKRDLDLCGIADSASYPIA